MIGEKMCVVLGHSVLMGVTETRGLEVYFTRDT